MATSNVASPPSTPQASVGPAQLDACGLLKSDEVEASIKSPIKEHKSSESWSGSLRVSQCVYVAEQLNKSVSLVVTQTDSARGGKQSARDFWRERFGRYREESEEKKEAAEKETERRSGKEIEAEREGRPPRKVEGLGDEAFWTAGSLYVLKKDAFLRVSVGGPDPEETKLKHSKALAAIALKRL